MATEYDIGDLPRVKATFTDLDDTNVNPTTVSVTVLKPNGTSATYEYGTDEEVVREATGIYYIDVSVDQSGRWRYRWESTGTGQAAEEGTFRVKTQRVATS